MFHIFYDKCVFEPCTGGERVVRRCVDTPTTHDHNNTQVGLGGAKWRTVIQHNTMFIGEHQHSIDEKGRLQLPVKWRSQLAAGAVITKGFDGSLKFYPLAEWEAIAEKLAALPQSQPSSRAYVRQTLAGAVDVQLDRLGRVLVPGYLREFASLGKATVLAGLFDHIEVWNADAWKKYQAGIDQDTDEFRTTLKEIGI